MDKNAVKIMDTIEAFNKDLEHSRPLHEINGIALDNRKKEIEIEILRKQLNDYKTTKILAWIGGLTGTILTILKAIELYTKKP